MFVEGALFRGTRIVLPEAAEAVQAGRPFDFEVVRDGATLTFSVDGELVLKHTVPKTRLGDFGFRPWRSTMTISQFEATGDLVSPPFTEQDLFVSGQGGYHTYRIPAIVATKTGTVLAFCEGRKKGRGDSGDIDMLLRRSTDGGKTWGKTHVVWDDAGNTCGNPAPVVDRETGAIWLLMTHNLGRDREHEIIEGKSDGTRTIWVTHSTDDGARWAKPVEITATTKEPDWTWYATGPCNGIQLTHGEHKGRLVVPCDHIEAGNKRYYSHVIYSDDHGKTWQLGGSSPQHQVNECTVVELADGRLLLNMRNYDRAKHSRQICFSNDGGTTWKDQRHDEALIEPICQASILRYSWPDGSTPGRILFANPASRTGRDSMTVRMSLDEGKSWTKSKLIHSAGSAYSCLVRMPDGAVGCLYEKDGYQRISLARLPLRWIEK
jgi:sialidase-1